MDFQVNGSAQAGFLSCSTAINQVFHSFIQHDRVDGLARAVSELMTRELVAMIAENIWDGHESVNGLVGSHSVR